MLNDIYNKSQSSPDHGTIEVKAHLQDRTFNIISHMLLKKRFAGSASLGHQTIEMKEEAEAFLSMVERQATLNFWAHFWEELKPQFGSRMADDRATPQPLSDG